MLTKLTVRNFKRFEDVEIALENPVVFIGPNNSGKTSAMQALALWHTGLRIWNARRAGDAAPEKRLDVTVMKVNRPVRPVSSSPPKKRPGVTVNRRDAIAVPVPRAALLWRGLRTRDTTRKADGGQSTKNVRVEIVVEGVSEGRAWTCGLEFDYANPESFYCRPLRTEAGRMPVPPAAGAVRLAFLPPMSGLAATETRIDEGAVDVRIGEERTAECRACRRIPGRARASSAPIAMGTATCSGRRARLAARRWRPMSNRADPAAAMNAHLAAIGAAVAPPANLALPELPPYSAEPDPMETVFQYRRRNRLANRAFADAAAAVAEACRKAWDRFAAMPDRIASIMRREWAAIPAQAHTDQNGRLRTRIGITPCPRTLYRRQGPDAPETMRNPG